METQNGVKLTDKQVNCIKKLEKVLKNWDKDLHLNAIAGVLMVMLKGDTKQNPNPEMSSSNGFNQDNIIKKFPDIMADGGDW